MELFEVLKNIINPQVFILSLIVWMILSYRMYRALKEEQTEYLNGPVQFGLSNSKYHLSHGCESGIFFDYDKTSGAIEPLSSVAQWYIDNIKELDKKNNIDFLVFIEKESGPIGALTLKDHVSLITNKPSVVIRTKKRIRPLSIKNRGLLKGKNVVIISDVSTTGSTVDDAVTLIKENFAEVTAALIIWNRGGVKTKDHFSEQNIDLKYMSDQKDLCLS